MDNISNPCAICLETIEEIPTTKACRTLTAFFCRKVQKKDTDKIALSCGHEFHRVCIENWATDKPQCPLDRGFITSLPSCYEKVREALFTAIELNQIDEVNRILSDGFNLDQCSSPDNKNPLTLSLQKGRWKISGMLVRAGATTDNMEAQNFLGRLYQKGEGVEQNDAEAFFWYGRAADQGSATAQYNLGRMYDRGQGVEKNDTKALTWYRSSACQNYAPAQYRLGWMYQNGLGVKQNFAKARDWYHKAATKDYEGAINQLGWMDEKGLGGEQNLTKALIWYSKATLNGSTSAKKNLLRLINNYNRNKQDSRIDLQDFSLLSRLNMCLLRRFIERNHLCKLWPEIYGPPSFMNDR